MKFAVVEYNSKSGNIWRHTSERPNYLADPQKEIDPTSFGCYVSALEGEHIPLKGLITGPVNTVSSPTRLYRKLVKRLSGSWPSYNIEYLLQFDVLLVVHQLSDAHEMARLVSNITMKQLLAGRSLGEGRNNRPLVIGVPTQPYGLLKPAIEADPVAKQDLVDFINSCDVFISVVRSTVGWYEDLSRTAAFAKATAAKPVRYVPQPYPVSYATQFQKPLTDKEKTILVAGVTQRANIKQGQQIARELQKKFPEYHILIPKVEEYDYDFSNLANAKYTVLPFEQWQKHLKTLATATLVINTDYTQTRGRVQTDCAAVRTPSLGGNSDGQDDLFPKLRSTPETDTGSLMQLGEKLLINPAFYFETTQYALARLKKYDYEESAARILNLTYTTKN